jgi:cytidine deaminase
MSLAEPAPVSVEQLLEHARSAATLAHAPYSRFRVGAAVLAGGRVFVGCNVENASYGLCMCAERVAAFKAVSEGHPRLSMVAVSCIDADATLGVEGRMPCGACRQVLAELADPEVPIHIDGVGSSTLAELLPRAFRLR